tara:strand:+ start:1633 stop:1755 length:123 start_codon:yes stop_codon:yes gene_type:complete
MEQMLIGMFAGSDGGDLMFLVSLGLMGLYAVYGELKLRGF